MTECFEVWPTRGFDQYVAEAVDRMSSEARGDFRAAELERFFRKCSVEADLDRYGRLAIPEFLREHARLDESAVIVCGAGDHLEIWRREPGLSVDGPTDR
jgi:DNA-binding transcriptional regulator/RsmH inhibitor MraZ